VRGLLAVMRKELRAYLVSPVAYVVIAMFLVTVGFLYSSIVMIVARQSIQLMRFQGFQSQLSINEMVLHPTFRNATVILLFIMPLLTMRLFAEEKKGRTMELLLTSPISITAIVVGKFLAALMLYALMLLLTLYAPILMALFGQIEWGPVFVSYLGLLLVGSSFLALGLFTSALTENQVIAASSAFGMLLLFWLLGFAGQAAEGRVVGQLLQYLSIFGHLDNFLKGLLVTTDVVYFVSFTVFGVFLTHRAVESHRWR